MSERGFVTITIAITKYLCTDVSAEHQEHQLPPLPLPRKHHPLLREWCIVFPLNHPVPWFEKCLLTVAAATAAAAAAAVAVVVVYGTAS